MSQTIYPMLMYRDARAAITFLERAFGFRRVQLVEGEDEIVIHAELALEGNLVMISSQGAGRRFPGGPTTIYVHVADPDAHSERARSAGAEIAVEMTEDDAAGREYGAQDPEGNVWVFGTYVPESARGR